MYGSLPYTGILFVIGQNSSLDSEVILSDTPGDILEWDHLHCLHRHYPGDFFSYPSPCSVISCSINWCGKKAHPQLLHVWFHFFHQNFLWGVHPQFTKLIILKVQLNIQQSINSLLLGSSTLLHNIHLIR